MMGLRTSGGSLRIGMGMPESMFGVATCSAMVCSNGSGSPPWIATVSIQALVGPPADGAATSKEHQRSSQQCTHPFLPSCGH